MQTQTTTASTDTMQRHDYDDGLVHSHGWARESRERKVTVRVQDYDDGLVHAHAWAMSSPER
jgi:hypothetical protein